MNERLPNLPAIFSRSVLFSALALVWSAPVGAVDPVLEPFIKPDSRIEFGALYLSDDGRQANEYTGLRRGRGWYGLLDLSVLRRDDATGIWSNVDVLDLGTDAREVRFAGGRQGSWSYGLEYSGIPHAEPYVVNTSLLGVGTARQTVVP